jgi:single-strand DNA-binding protein
MGHSTEPAMNVVILEGRVSNAPQIRALPAGDNVANFDVATKIDGSTLSVPVSWHRPEARLLDVMTSDVPVVVVGTVRRRFFRAGGVTQSRTEVVADTVLPTRRAKTVRTTLRRVSAEISERVE